MVWAIEEKFAVRLGGNTYINTPNLIAYKGTWLFRMRRSSEDGMLGIDFDVHDARGKTIAVIAKNVVVKGDATKYDITSSHEHYSVTEKSTDRVIAMVRRRGVQNAELDVHVRMYLPNGQLLDAGPETTNLGSMTVSGLVIENCGVGIDIR